MNEKFVMKKPSGSTKISNCDLFKRFIFMWNDGIAFFNPMADHKLPRLVGIKPGWFDKFKNARNIIKYLVSVIIFIIVISSQL